MSPALMLGMVLVLGVLAAVATAAVRQGVLS